MNVKERLLAFIEHKRMNVAQFQFTIGVSRAYVQNLGQNIGATICNRIKAEYPELNMQWLQYGVGEMLVTKEEGVKSEIEIIPIMPIAAQGGSLLEFTKGIRESDCEFMTSPIKGATLAITISGDSMWPEYPNGSKVLVKKINEEAFIDWGCTFVLDTCNGVVIKNIFPDSDGYIRCHSVNPNFPDFRISTSDIYGWYKVLMVFSLK